MNKKMVYVFGIIVLLIIIISLIPGKKKKPSLQAISLTYEHASQTMPKLEPNTKPQITEEATTLVESTQSLAGYSSYVDGTFTMPTPSVAPDNNDDNQGNTDDNNSGDNNSGDNNSSDNSNNDNKPDDSNVDKTDPMNSFVPKDPSQVSDTGARAITTTDIVLRVSPYYRKENAVDSLAKDSTLVVTNKHVESSDEAIAFWVEVLYYGKIYYVRSDMVELRE